MATQLVNSYKQLQQAEAKTRLAFIEIQKALDLPARAGVSRALSLEPLLHKAEDEEWLARESFRIARDKDFAVWRQEWLSKNKKAPAGGRR